MGISKLYCFVDETGQDTAGKLFLVAVVLKDIGDLVNLEEKLFIIEEKSGKRKLKWKKVKKEIKKTYLEQILSIKTLKESIFYSIYENTKEYSKLTSLTIAKALLAKENKNYTATIIIDGLNEKERQVVRLELKKLRIRYRKIRGMKDEQSVFLRLADAMAGFIREVYEEVPYTKSLISRFKQKKVISET